MCTTIDNVRLASMEAFDVTPGMLKERYKLNALMERNVQAGRSDIVQCLNHEDERILMIVGPCSIHDEQAAYEFAERLSRLQHEVRRKIRIVMRCYFEKPRTVSGWKGLVCYPDLDEVFDPLKGVRMVRRILYTIVRDFGVPVATETLDLVLQNYFSDLIAFTAIGARNVTSQNHRELAAGLSMPVGFKNDLSGNMKVAVDAMESAAIPGGFIGVNDRGSLVMARTKGNQDTCLILRGGAEGPNYGPAALKEASAILSSRKIVADRIIVDASHGNSEKDHTRQIAVAESVLESFAKGHLRGLMLESNLKAGKQEISSSMEYGVSVTDSCISIDDFEEFARSAFKYLVEK